MDAQRQATAYCVGHLGSHDLEKGATGEGALQTPLQKMYFPYKLGNRGRTGSTGPGPEKQFLRVDPEGLSWLHGDGTPRVRVGYESVLYCEAMRFVTIQVKKKVLFAFDKIAADLSPSGRPPVQYTPLDKKHQSMTFLQHPALVALILRRTSGPRAIGVQAFVAESAQEAATFITELKVTLAGMSDRSHLDYPITTPLSPKLVPPHSLSPAPLPGRRLSAADEAVADGSDQFMSPLMRSAQAEPVLDKFSFLSRGIRSHDSADGPEKVERAHTDGHMGAPHVQASFEFIKGERSPVMPESPKTPVPMPAPQPKQTASEQEPSRRPRLDNVFSMSSQSSPEPPTPWHHGSSGDHRSSGNDTNTKYQDKQFFQHPQMNIARAGEDRSSTGNHGDHSSAAHRPISSGLADMTYDLIDPAGSDSEASRPVAKVQPRIVAGVRVLPLNGSITKDLLRRRPLSANEGGRGDGEENPRPSRLVSQMSPAYRASGQEEALSPPWRANRPVSPGYSYMSQPPQTTEQKLVADLAMSFGHSQANSTGFAGQSDGGFETSLGYLP